MWYKHPADHPKPCSTKMWRTAASITYFLNLLLIKKWWDFLLTVENKELYWGTMCFFLVYDILRLQLLHKARRMTYWQEYPSP